MDMKTKPVTDELRINGERLWASLMELAKIGATEKGGVCRLTLTDLDRDPNIHGYAFGPTVIGQLAGDIDGDGLLDLAWIAGGFHAGAHLWVMAGSGDGSFYFFTREGGTCGAARVVR